MTDLIEGTMRADEAYLKVGKLEVRPMAKQLNPWAYEVFIDGQQIQYVKSIIVTIDSCKMPTATMTFCLPQAEQADPRQG